MPRHLRWGAAGLLCGIVLVLAGIGVASLVDGDGGDRSRLERAPEPDIYRAQRTAAAYIRYLRPTENMKVEFCEGPFSKSVLPPFRYICQVRQGRRVYSLRVTEDVVGQLGADIDDGRLPTRKDLSDSAVDP